MAPTSEMTKANLANVLIEFFTIGGQVSREFKLVMAIKGNVLT